MLRKKTFPLQSGDKHSYPELGKPDNGPVVTVVPPGGGLPGPHTYLWVGAKNGACFAHLDGAKLRDLARQILKCMGEK